ncbi:MAG: YybS family protein [Fretibacterium sp.]|nr:YybS family protein [Fretibacterium sp.]
MFKDGRTAPLVRTIFFAVLTSLLIALGIFFPLLSFWGLLICPLPLALLGCREGARWLGAGIFLTETLLLLLSPSVSLYFLLGCAPLSLVLFILAEKQEKLQWTGGESLFGALIVSILAKLTVMAFFWVLTGRNFLIPDLAQMELLLGELGTLPPDQLLTLQETLRQTAALLPYMTPSLILLWSGLEVLVNYHLCERILKRRGVDRRPPALPPFAEWRFPTSLLPAMVLSIILGFFLDADKWFEAKMFVVNLRLVLNILFFVQGISLGFWWMKHRNFRPLARFLLLLLALFPLTWIWLIVLGMGDMAFDIRSRIKQRGQ